MRIIKEGNITPKETKKTCFKCKTKFTFFESEIECDREGRYVKCPICKAFIAVN